MTAGIGDDEVEVVGQFGGHAGPARTVVRQPVEQDQRSAPGAGARVVEASSIDLDRPAVLPSSLRLDIDAPVLVRPIT